MLHWSQPFGSALVDNVDVAMLVIEASSGQSGKPVRSMTKRMEVGRCAMHAIVSRSIALRSASLRFSSPGVSVTCAFAKPLSRSRALP